jgi:hypothetical protein
MRLSKSRVTGTERPVYLVSRDIDHAKILPLRFGQSFKVGSYFFKQIECAEHICLDEVARTVDGPVNVTFGRKVQDSARLMLRQHLTDELLIGDIAMDKLMSRVMQD